MSSDEAILPPVDSHGLPILGRGRKRSQRSCDSCRMRKTRCDGPNMPDGCSNCLAFGCPCTYLQPTRKRGPKSRLVEELKQKNASLEAKLRSLSICSLCAQPLTSRMNLDGASSDSLFTPENGSTVIHTDTVHPPPDHDDSSQVQAELADLFRRLALNSEMKRKFFGSSSSFELVSKAIAVKEKYLGRPAESKHLRRPLFWDILPWEKKEYAQQPQYVFPSSDLIDSLLELYFTNVHPIFPVTHRPLVEQAVKEGVHMEDTHFGAVLLVMLGIASRYSDDPRVFEDDASHSAGWNFVKQVEIIRKEFDPTLPDLQFYGLMTLWSVGTSVPHTSWMYLGLGIRCLQHRGAHRRKAKNEKWDPSDELFKRAFWGIFLLDQHLSFFQGRPPGIHMEDYDLELPLEVDDEYWEHGFIQPPGKPSQLSYFVYHIRLCEILGDTMRRLYASNRSRSLMGWTGPEWEQRAVWELDSAMNDLLGSIPQHLRWDPERTAGTFFDQSAVLYAAYYYIQIGIHRPYIHKSTLSGSPSLAICTSAARAGLAVADVWLQKMQRLPLPFLLNTVFFSGVTLMLNIFASNRVGISVEKNKDLTQIARAMAFLKFAETRWQPAGRLWELLQELHSLDGPLSRWPPQIALYSPGSNEDGESPSSSMKSDTPQVKPAKRSLPLWDTINSCAPPPNDPKPEISIEQLLADTAEFDRCDSLANTWSDTSGLPNGLLDPEFMSLWMPAPTNAGLPQWDTYGNNNPPNFSDAPPRR